MENSSNSNPNKPLTKHQPLLSICIPTYNRSNLLKKTLDSIINQTYFKESRDIEVVVSDNCSSDNTWEVVKEFQLAQPGLVKYIRSEENDHDLNFERALRHGTGRFLKLHNDSFGWRDKSVEAFAKILSEIESRKPTVFIVNERTRPGEISIKSIANADQFLEEVCYRCTWIGGFGIWKEDLDRLPDFSRRFETKLIQVDVLLRLTSQQKTSLVIKAPMFESYNTGRKSGYNIAEVFGANYLRILKEHLASGNISIGSYERAKRGVLIDHIIPFLFSAEHDFGRDDLGIHLTDYVSESYFVPALLQATSAFAENSKRVALQGNEKLPMDTNQEFTQAWRAVNNHNETLPGFPMPLSKVSIGRRTYGTINAYFWGHSEEYLKIGHFCSIAGGVEFVAGGNHSINGFSTFPFKCKYFGSKSEAISRGPIIIEDDVWICHRAIILSGVRIGRGSVIGAAAVVTRDVPPYAVVGGNPAKILRYRFDESVIQELMRIDYESLTDETLNALGDRLYEEIGLGNVCDFVRSLNSGGSQQNL